MVSLIKREIKQKQDSHGQYENEQTCLLLLMKITHYSSI